MKPRLLLGCSGSVATIKVPELVAELSERFEVLVVVSKNSRHFLNRAKDYNSNAWGRFLQLGGYDLVIHDEDEWESWNKLGDLVIHIELRIWADILLVAPASANLIASASIGSCDNLLLSVLRAWDFSKPCVMCPAMNTVMWDHPATASALNILRGWGWQIVGPIEKLLACNERGNGAMSSVADITDFVSQFSQTVDASSRTKDESEGLCQMLSRRNTSLSTVPHELSTLVSSNAGIGVNWNKAALFVSVGIFIGVVAEKMLLKR